MTGWSLSQEEAKRVPKMSPYENTIIAGWAGFTFWVCFRTMNFCHYTAVGLVIAVKAKPGAKKIRIGPVLHAPQLPGWPAARLKIAVNVPPQGGKANAVIISALAEWLGVREADICQIAGKTARDKKFLISGQVTIPKIRPREAAWTEG